MYMSPTTVYSLLASLVEFLVYKYCAIDTVGLFYLNATQLTQVKQSEGELRQTVTLFVDYLLFLYSTCMRLK